MDVCYDVWIIMSIFTGIATAAVQQERALKFKEYFRYENVYITDFVLWSTDNCRSTIQCAGMCVTDLRCLAFSVNNLTKYCTGYTDTLSDGLTSTSSFGTVYYTLKRNSFAEGFIQGSTDSPLIDESSGLAASRIHENVLYTHNDNGDSARLFAFRSSDGHMLAKLPVTGATHGDWEDIAAGVCPDGGYCLYIADTGNGANTIYRVREPAIITDQSLPLDGTLRFTWSYTYDIETIMVDPFGNLYIVTSDNEKIGEIPTSAWDGLQPYLITQIATVHIPPPTSEINAGDISPDGQEIIIKTLDNIYYWYTRSYNYLEIVQSLPDSIPFTYVSYSQQALCWDREGQGYFVSSEGTYEDFYYYARLN